MDTTQGDRGGWQGGFPAQMLSSSWWRETNKHTHTHTQRRRTHRDLDPRLLMEDVFLFQVRGDGERWIHKPGFACCWFPVSLSLFIYRCSDAFYMMDVDDICVGISEESIHTHHRHINLSMEEESLQSQSHHRYSIAFFFFLVLAPGMMLWGNERGTNTSSRGCV